MTSAKHSGGAGTVVNNLMALGVGRIEVVGVRGDDGEGYELQRALEAMPGVSVQHLVIAPERRTFTYCKPLIVEPGREPVELNRLDSKNWTPTPKSIEARLIERPTPLEHGVAAWVLTFRAGWLDRAGVPNHERIPIAEAVADRVGSNVADYVRLRFIMRKPS